MVLGKTFFVLSDKNRRTILHLLKKKERTVSEIQQHLHITMATLSHHLDILKKADLVSSRRSAQKIYYSLNLSVIEDISEKIIAFLSLKKS